MKDFRKKGVDCSLLYVTDEQGNISMPELVENEFVVLKSDQSLRKTQLGRVKGKKVVPLEFRKAKPYGVAPRNAGQHFLQEALMLPAEEVPLVIVKGMAGTAKTFYSLAVGLEKLLNNPTGGIQADSDLSPQRPVRRRYRIPSGGTSRENFTADAPCGSIIWSSSSIPAKRNGFRMRRSCREK